MVAVYYTRIKHKNNGTASKQKQEVLLCLLNDLLKRIGGHNTGLCFYNFATAYYKNKKPKPFIGFLNNYTTSIKLTFL